jgi:hypothetical protein
MLLAMMIPTLAGATETDATPDSDRVVPVEATKESADVVLYYFHGSRRCNTCRTIESFAREAVEGRYRDALRTGTLRWAALNVDEGRTPTSSRNTIWSTTRSFSWSSKTPWVSK